MSEKALSHAAANIISDNPDFLQNRASNPHESVWVSASAGTGKTKVLTDRVLRLLLPRNDGQPATPPHKILCLTFTKAAANEMALRISEMLGKWAVMPVGSAKDSEKTLWPELQKLLGQPPTQNQIEAAQRLFAEVVDGLGGLQIMTIHAFCQSVLGCFPLEADLMPNFCMLDEAESMELLKTALAILLDKIQKDENRGSPLWNALERMTGEIGEDDFFKVMTDVCRERHQFSLHVTQGIGHDEDGAMLHARICRYYDIATYQTNEGELADFCKRGAINENGLINLAHEMKRNGGKTEQGFAVTILSWIQADAEKRKTLFSDYKKVFVTTDSKPRTHNFPTKKIKELIPESSDLLAAEAERILMLDNTLRKIKSAVLTRDILLLSGAVLENYEQLKRSKGGVDFDDLILKTMNLLRGDTQTLSGMTGNDLGLVASWIMYKMDQGLDHILVDEAQDTNPEQWQIIEALCGEFFSGLGARDNVQRTSFTVGDIKQSIYSFQRAAPEEFQRMQALLKTRIEDAGQNFNDVALQLSFRSTAPILQAVDSVFSAPALQQGAGMKDVRHKSFREGQAGIVELWPVFETPKSGQQDFWFLPLEIQSQKSGSAQLAEFIAQKIHGWITNGEQLSSHGRAIQAGDIMVLVRTRSAFVDQLIRALKVLNIPVSGTDRMVLSDQLAVQDILALAKFCLLPQDDLNLAVLLKSPFLGWSEDNLFSLAYGRGATLWDALKTTVPELENASQTLDYLNDIRSKSRILPVYEFLSYILQSPTPSGHNSGLKALQERLGIDILDPVQELLGSALSFRHNHTDQLQIFIDVQENQKIEIKREMEESGGLVRIMTVHGSKGLQAPIVIMPDTISSRSSKSDSRLLWPQKTGIDIPLFAARKDDQPEEYTRLAEKRKYMAEQESHRLLYVAMTRAADRLYVAGYKGKTSSSDTSWYDLVRAGMNALDHVEELDNGILRLSCPQTKPPDREKVQKKKEQMQGDLPAWVHTPAQPETLTARPLSPSRLTDDEDISAALSPLSAPDNYRFRRGNVTHKLLQFLPDFDADKRAEAARGFVDRTAPDLPQHIRTDIVDEVLKVMNHPDFSMFFSAKSMAEVPLTGVTSSNRVISGQIDRLVIAEHDIWIIDYKTNRPPPQDAKDVPLAYKRQLQAYRETIASIYPNHKIHTALLWTDGCRLMIV